MMYTLAGVLAVLWLLGIMMSFGGAWIHVLLVIAIVLVLVQLYGKKGGGSMGGSGMMGGGSSGGGSQPAS